ATFSPELSDLTLYVIDVAAGDKIPRKGGPGITKSDLLGINKIDRAPMVGASLEVMARDAKKMRGERPFQFTNLKTGQGLDAIIPFIEKEGMLCTAQACICFSLPARRWRIPITARAAGSRRHFCTCSASRITWR